MNDSAEKHFGSEPFPRKPLFGALALVAIAVSFVTVSRITHVGAPTLQDPSEAVAYERDLRFEDRPDGSIAVLDANGGALVLTLEPGKENFVRGTLRSLVRERRRESIGKEMAFKLIARKDGHLLLNDPATSRTIDLGSFGPTNIGSFARMLTTRETPSTQTASVSTPAQ